MEVMETLETSPVAHARTVAAAMVLPVVHEGEIVVSGIQPEDEQRGEPDRKHEPEQPPNNQGPRHDDAERRADERSWLGVVVRVTASRHRGRAVQEPPMYDVLQQATEHEPHDRDATRHHPGARESMQAEGEKDQRRGQVADHSYPIIASAVDHPIEGTEQRSSGLTGHQFTHSRPPCGEAPSHAVGLSPSVHGLVGSRRTAGLPLSRLTDVPHEGIHEKRAPTVENAARVPQ
jgi:hypothetical protein